jgi:hypothetical protein
MSDERHYQELKDRLENWAKWCRDRSSVRHPADGVCIPLRSLERYYRPPPCWEPTVLIVEVDILDAVAIEKVITGLPIKNKAALKFAYVMPWANINIQLRKIGIRFNDYDDTVRLSECMVMNILSRNTVVDI